MGIKKTTLMGRLLCPKLLNYKVYVGKGEEYQDSGLSAPTSNYNQPPTSDSLVLLNKASQTKVPYYFMLSRR